MSRRTDSPACLEHLTYPFKITAIKEPFGDSPKRLFYLLGNVLLSQNPAVQVPLALEGLTVVFEMGTRGSPPPSLPNVVYICLAYTKQFMHIQGLFPEN
jgi:hypothetical protein